MQNYFNIPDVPYERKSNYGEENMTKQEETEEMAKRLPTIEEIEKEYKEWAVNLLRVRLDLDPEYYDIHHHNNYTYENCVDCLWNKIKGSIEELLLLRNQISEDIVVLTKKEYEVLKVKAKEKHWFETCMAVWENAKIYARKETAKEIISFIESKDKISGKYSIYTKLLQELKEKYLEVEE